MNWIDHEWTSFPVCPHCGHEHRDAWEWGDDNEDSECESCDRIFHAYRHVDITWDTAAPEGGEDE